MAVDKLVDSTQLNSDLTSIANAIRTKGGTSAQLSFPSGFVTAIGAISTGGGNIVITDETNATGTTAVITGNEITLTTKTINQNGTYNASSDNADGYSAVTVNVSSGGSTTWETVYNGSVSITDWGDELYYVQLRDYFSEHAGFVYGETYRVTWKGYPYICDVQEQIDYYGAGDTYCIGNATLGGGTTGNNEPFFAMPWYDNLMFATTDSSGTFTLTIEKQVSSGGSPSATQHSIYFEFSDNTNTTIPVYYNDSFVSTMITAYKPVTYGLKTVTLAQLDGVTWYEPADIPIGVELIDSTKLTNGYAVGDDGDPTENEWSYISDYTEVDPSMTFSYTGWYWYYIGIYDDNKSVLRTIYCMSDATVDPNDGNLGHGTLSGNKLSNAKYVRISGPSNGDISLIRTA